MDDEVMTLVTTNCPSCMEAFDAAMLWTMDDLKGLSSANIDELFGHMMGPKNRFMRAMSAMCRASDGSGEQLLQHSMTTRSAHTCLTACR